MCASHAKSDQQVSGRDSEPNRCEVQVAIVHAIVRVEEYSHCAGCHCDRKKSPGECCEQHGRASRRAVAAKGNWRATENAAERKRPSPTYWHEVVIDSDRSKP